MKSSRYTLDFANGVKFDLSVVMSDTMTAATAATLLKGVSVMKQGRAVIGAGEGRSMDSTTSIDSNSGTLTVDYSASESQFTNLLNSQLFQQRCKVKSQ